MNNFNNFLTIINNDSLNFSSNQNLSLQKDNLNKTDHHVIYLEKIKSFLRILLEIQNHGIDNYINSHSLEHLKAINNQLYADILIENYNQSYANPTYCKSIFSSNTYNILSYIYISFRHVIRLVFHQKSHLIKDYADLYIEFEKWVYSDRSEDKLKSIAGNFYRRDKKESMSEEISLTYNPENSTAKKIINKSNSSDLRYLFAYGAYITEDEIKTAKEFWNIPDEKINEMAFQISDSYFRGRIGRIEIDPNRTSIMLNCTAGQEKLIKKLIEEVEKNDHQIILSSVSIPSPNRQYLEDHQDDEAIFLCEEDFKQQMEEYKYAINKNEDKLKKFGGVIMVEQFGDSPQPIKHNPDAPQYSAIQKEIYQNKRQAFFAIHETVAPRKNSSFTIVAFPGAGIGDKFEEILKGIWEVNLLSSPKYEKIHQSIIKTLDKGIGVKVTGKNNNETDLFVAFQNNPDVSKYTCFNNCVADINIPVGEVYTTPQLKNTKGKLHVIQAFLENREFHNLKLEFIDGMITNCSCTNFETEEENREYVEKSLMFPFKTLPLGEFAIGTNTLAWYLCQKYNISDRLPILIKEKMGPHFAIGDTCYCYQEDIACRNAIDNREVIARDNEKTIVRKENIKEAYTLHHTDITIPYDELGKLSVITHDNKEIDIIKDGFFVLPGTEELNEPLHMLKEELK